MLSESRAFYRRNLRFKKKKLFFSFFLFKSSGGFCLRTAVRLLFNTRTLADDSTLANVTHLNICRVLLSHLTMSPEGYLSDTWLSIKLLKYFAPVWLMQVS